MTSLEIELQMSMDRLTLDWDFLIKVVFVRHAASLYKSAWDTLAMSSLCFQSCTLAI